MNLLVFISDDGSPEGTGPIVIVPERKDAVLARNPRSFEWRYFATITEQDSILDSNQQAECLQCIADDGFYLANRLIYAYAAAEPEKI
jgi:hypothetical protein